MGETAEALSVIELWSSIGKLGLGQLHPIRSREYFTEWEKKLFSFLAEVLHRLKQKLLQCVDIVAVSLHVLS